MMMTMEDMVQVKGSYYCNLLLQSMELSLYVGDDAADFSWQQKNADAAASDVALDGIVNYNNRTVLKVDYLRRQDALDLHCDNESASPSCNSSAIESEPSSLVFSATESQLSAPPDLTENLQSDLHCANGTKINQFDRHYASATENHYLSSAPVNGTKKDRSDQHYAGTTRITQLERHYDSGTKNGQHVSGSEKVYTIKLVIGKSSVAASESINECPTLDDHSGVADDWSRYFDERRSKFQLDSRSVRSGVPSLSIVPSSSIDCKMEHLRTEMESLVKQDDALFRQLLALRSSIHDIRQLQLRNQDRQDFCRSSSCSRSSSRSNSGVHSLSGSSSSLNSTDNTDDADPDQDHPQVMLLTRNKISYPPNKLRVNKLTSGSSPSSVCSSSGSSEEEWPQARILKSGRRLPQTVSPHLSFYRTKEHQRQGSYDSGIHASEPSDAEVFV